MLIRRSLAALLLAAAPGALAAAPVPKERLLVPPSNADHFVVVSAAGKHGDEWRWTLPDGSVAYRESILLRGLVFEDDAVVKFGPDGMPVAVTVRGVQPSGDVGETFVIGAGRARWTSPVDQGETAYAKPAFYVSQGGPFLAAQRQYERIVAAGQAGLPLLPSGTAHAEKLRELQVTGPDGPKTISLWAVSGLSQAPQPVWFDAQGKLFGALVGLGILPAGYEKNYEAMQAAQDEAIAARSPQLAAKYLGKPDPRPILFRDVKLYDAIGRRFLDHQSVLVSDGKIASVARAGSFPAPPSARVIDGAGKTLVPGLWDSHMHIGDDNNALSELAIGVTSYRDPGTEITPTLSKRARRAAGQLLAPNAYPSIIIDGKGPLSAQGGTTVSSEAETIAAVRKAAANGFNIKFYTSMNPAWIAPGAAEAHRLGLHVHGHVPAHMRPLDAISAGYDEITHINFVIMQAMPQDVVDHSNGKMRFEGPGKYAGAVDLDAEPMRGLIATMAKRHITVDPTLVVYESLLTQEAGTMPKAYAPYVGTLPAATERGFKAGGYPLPADVTRATWRASFAKLGALVNRLHKAGVPLVAGTDGGGLELVRELELYVDAGLTPADALATATINPARLVGHGGDTGSITAGKTADLLLVDGDPSRAIGDLRHVNQVVLGGVLLDGDALRKDAGFSGRPR